MLSPKQALDFIRQHKTVAIVGLSPKTDRPSHRVGRFLLEKKYNIIPVAPRYDEILGKPCVKSLADLEPGSVDWVDLFVNPDRLLDFAEDIVKLSPNLVWCQIGVVNEEFNKLMEKANIPYIANVCPKIELEKEDG